MSTYNTNPKSDATILSAEPSTTFFIESGVGSFIFTVSESDMFMRRQVGSGYADVVHVNVLGDRAGLKVDVREWEAAAHRGIQKEIRDAIDAARRDRSLPFTAAQKKLLAELSSTITATLDGPVS